MLKLQWQNRWDFNRDPSQFFKKNANHTDQKECFLVMIRELGKRKPKIADKPSSISLAIGIPVRVVRPLNDQELEWILSGSNFYVELAKEFIRIF